MTTTTTSTDEIINDLEQQVESLKILCKLQEGIIKLYRDKQEKIFNDPVPISIVPSFDNKVPIVHIDNLPV